MEKTPEKYICEICDFKCNKNSEWTRHISTRKHLFRINLNEKNANKMTLHKCKNCNKSYKAKNSLWYHEKKCILENKLYPSNLKQYPIHSSLTDDNQYLIDLSKEDDPDEMDVKNLVLNSDNTINASLLMEIVKQTQEFKNLLIEQNNKINELSVQNSIIQNNITTNTTNNSFNLNFFLNETCKDAMNIVDFVNSMQLTIEDFETTGKLGFVDGISRIFIKELKGMDVEKRPVHCTDAKRETVYIKDNNAWEKENNEKKKFKWVINRIAQLNLNKIKEWQQRYPECVINNTKENERFTELALVALGGRGAEEEEKYREKIMKNVLKEVVINKSSLTH